MNVLLVYYEPRQSGHTTHVLSIARYINKELYKLTIVLPKHLADCMDSFKETGAQTVILPMHKLFWPFSSIGRFVRLIHKEKIDIVHIHSQESGMTTRPIAWLAGARHILYTPQTIDIRQTRWNWFYVLLERCLEHLTTVIISVNERDRKRIVRWGIPDNKTRTIPNGIATETGESKIRNQLKDKLHGDQEPDPTIVQVGRISAQKNPLAFVEGAALVIKEVPKARFFLVGEGPLEELVRQRIEDLGLTGKVRMTGWQRDVSPLMGRATAVTLTSLWEGAPYSLLEAMAWGKPVVATTVNGCSEIVENGITGYLAPPNDPKKWAECVISLIKDPELASAMGQRGRQRVEKYYSIQKMIADLESLYSGITR